MRVQILSLLLLGFLSGCSSEWDNSRTRSAETSLQPAIAGPAGPGQPSPDPMSPRRGAPGFASLPDRGELLAYDRTRKVRHAGAYTWRPVELSEAHALRAIKTGELVMTDPDGEAIRLRYQRHVEHGEGNWTWIGRVSGGEAAVITFGEKAVFGLIPRPGRQALELTTSAGRSWLMTTDPSQLPPSRSRHPDFLVPPDMIRSAGMKSVTTMAGDAANGGQQAATTAASVNAVPADTVDILLGYTPGFAQAVGGESQALTKLQHLVWVTNQAYDNSGIVGRLRLVHTLQVAFPDATDNRDALEKLSGYKSGAGSIPVDPAFAALRAARDQYGADLVSLVRKFQAPESAGCGIAWLIGGDKSPIEQADAPFGYSVTSDGSDMDEGDSKWYGCRSEVLAHETGHNMGQAHNPEDSSGSGAHAYSHGYREAASNGFYTIMAYRLENSSQSSISYFANPYVKYQDRPTGTDGVADNAKSLNLTMPIIATFRAAATQVPLELRATNDIDGDGKSDLIWYQPQSTALAYWVMNGALVTRSYGQFISDAPVFAAGDFFADQKADVLVRTVSGEIGIWAGSGITFFSRPISAYPYGWEVLGSGDVDGDRSSDILWYNSASQVLAYWIMSGTSIVRSAGQVLPAGYRVVAIGDFYGDGRADVLLRGASGDLHMWNGNGYEFGGPHVAPYPAGWELLGVGDVDSDGKSDLLWYHPVSQVLAYWGMNGATIARGGGQAMPAGYKVVAIGDYYGDGRADVVLRGPYGDVHMWNGNGTTFGGPHVANYPAGWQLVR